MCRVRARVDAGGSRTGPIALFFAAKGGGVQKVQVLTANALAERGIEVACVLPEAEGAFLARLSPAVEVVDLGTRKAVALTRRLADYLRRERPAFLIASQQHTNLAALWARRLSGVDVRVIITQHNTLSALCRHSRRPQVRWLLPLAARVFFRWADQVWAVSDGVAADLSAMTGIPVREIEVVYNPVATPDLPAQASLASGHSWLDAKDVPVVLGAGNLIPIKDFATLIRAFARLRQHQPARLVILGEGPERANLERLVRELGVVDDVDLYGFTANPFAFMARADVFVLASRVEGLSNAIIEALACGCPVVSTACPHGPAEVLDDGRYGRLVPVGDDGALAEAIVATLHAPPDRNHLRARASFFSVERAADRYSELLGLQRRQPYGRQGGGQR